MIVIIPGIPVPKKRHRHGKHGGYDIQTKEKELYQLIMKKQVLDYINSEQKAKQLLMHKLSSSSAYHVDRYYHLPIPVSWSKRRRKEAREGRLDHNVKPDIDNLDKFLFDCMTGIFFDNDSKIISGTHIKKYSDKPYTAFQIQGKYE